MLMPKQTPRQTPKQKKTDEKLSLEELRDKRSHKGGELNNWDPAQLPIAHDLWKKHQEPGHTGKHYSICGLHWLTGIPYGKLRSVISSKINTSEPTAPLHIFFSFQCFYLLLANSLCNTHNQTNHTTYQSTYSLNIYLSEND